MHMLVPSDIPEASDHQKLAEKSSELLERKEDSPKQKLVIKEEKVTVASRYLQGVASEKVNGNGNVKRNKKVGSLKGKLQPKCEARSSTPSNNQNDAIKEKKEDLKGSMKETPAHMKSSSPRVAHTTKSTMPFDSHSSPKSNSKRRVVDTIAWDSLPSNLIKSGKGIVRRKNVAFSVVAEAQREATAAASVVKGLSIFADLRKSAAEENPHVSLIKFFSLQKLLKQPNVTVPALEDNFSRIPIPKETPPSEREKINRKSSLPTGGNAANPPSLSEQPRENEKLEWAKADGITEINEVRSTLQQESNSWFMGFLEGALSTGFQANRSMKKSTKDRTSGHSKETDGGVVVTLSQLKQASDWLDQVKNEAGHDTVERVDGLKQKIYACLLGRMETAASALENRSNRG